MDVEVRDIVESVGQSEHRVKEEGTKGHFMRFTVPAGLHESENG